MWRTDAVISAINTLASSAPLVCVSVCLKEESEKLLNCQSIIRVSNSQSPLLLILPRSDSRGPGSMARRESWLQSRLIGVTSWLKRDQPGLGQVKCCFVMEFFRLSGHFEGRQPGSVDEISKNSLAALKTSAIVRGGLTSRVCDQPRPPHKAA